MLVAVFVFSIVMMIAVGAIFSIVSANKTSQALKSVLDNLSSALDSMSRNIRYGTIYHCDPNDINGYNPNSCAAPGSSYFSFTPKDVLASDTTHRIIYYYNPAFYGSGCGAIEKCVGSVDVNACTALTAQEVHVTDMHFYVQGAETNNPM